MTNYQKSEEVLKYQNRRPVDNFQRRTCFNQHGTPRHCEQKREKILTGAAPAPFSGKNRTNRCISYPPNKIKALKIFSL